MLHLTRVWYKRSLCWVPVIIGKKIVEKIIEIKLSKEEEENFKKSVQSVKDLYSAAKNMNSVIIK